ncbi:MAG: PIG-L family deacetylase [Dehalococcoidia bacterium]
MTERTALVTVAHADDVAFFCGGRVARWAEEGWRVVVRATNDDKDSVGLDKAETERRNTQEFQAAMAALGVHQIEELGYVTDTLGDASEVELRERLIRLYRKHKPYAVMSFDPYGAFHEDNQDHIKVAQAADEAYWTSMFDKHHPEHFAEGLAPHAVFERWYFARRLLEVTDPIDVSGQVDKVIAAVASHETMLGHMVHQWRLQAATVDMEVPMLQGTPSLGAIAAAIVRAGLADTGRRHGLEYAEEYRVTRPPIAALARLGAL